MMGLPIFSGIGLRIAAQEYMASQNQEAEILSERASLTGRMKAGLIIFVAALVIQTFGAVKPMWNYNQMSAVFTLFIIYLIIILLNFFIISGEGKAVVLIPILSPLGQVLHVNQQILVLAYQYGDGFANMLYPTSGSLHAMLALGDVTYSQWVKFSWKLWTLLSLTGFGVILFAQAINYGPF